MAFLKILFKRASAGDGLLQEEDVMQGQQAHFLKKDHHQDRIIENWTSELLITELLITELLTTELLISELSTTELSTTELLITELSATELLTIELSTTEILDN